MGKKGAKLTTESQRAAESLVEALGSVGDVTSRKMFGGVGIFEDGTMFGIVDSAGEIFFRAGDENEELFEAEGSHRHGKMPYFSVPDSVLSDPEVLATWAGAAIAASRAAKK